VTNYYTIYTQFLKSRAQEHNLKCQTVSKNMLWGSTFRAFKTSGNWGYLIKRPSGRQGVTKLSQSVGCQSATVLAKDHHRTQS
jgi:hypothetical protein